jgi:hypothetical protein
LSRAAALSVSATGPSETTRYNYVFAAAQLVRYLSDYSSDADTAAEDPARVTRARVDVFPASMIGTPPASTALNQHKGAVARLSSGCRCRGGDCPVTAWPGLTDGQSHGLCRWRRLRYCWSHGTLPVVFTVVS